MIEDYTHTYIYIYILYDLYICNEMKGGRQDKVFKMESSRYYESTP